MTMADVEIYKESELYLSIRADRSIQYELLDRFSFYVPGFKHMPLFKSGVWDGKIRLFDTKTSRLPFGLIVDLIRFCKEGDYTFSLASDLKTVNLQTELDHYISTIPSTCTRSPTGKYSYQLDILKSAVKLNKALVLSSTGSGKSFAIYMLVRFLLENIEGDILITVPTIGLVTQLRKDFISYVADDFDIDAVMDFEHGAAAKCTSKRVLCATWQSIFRQPKSWYSRFNAGGAYICDEVHLADSKSITKIINMVDNTLFRVGFTGTLDGSKANEMALRGMFGPVINFASTKQLIENNVLSDLKIEILLIQYEKPVKKTFYETTRLYQDEIAWIIGNERRNDIIIKTALGKEKNTLVLFTLVDKHGILLYNRAREIENKYGKKIFFVSGDTVPEKREEIREYAENNNNVVIFGSYATMSTGINIKNLHHIIFAHPHKGRIRNLQSIGRSLRLHDEKTIATLTDIADDLSLGKKQNFTLQHLLQRLKIYSAEGFNYTINKVKSEEI